MKTKKVWLAIVVLFVGLALQTPSMQGAVWYVATSGVNVGSCGSSATPCATAAYVLANKVNAGDTIVINPGTYAGSLTLDAPSHQNVTITTTPAVIAALGTFRRGIPSGTDNRPYFSAAHVDVSVSGVTLSYLKIRNAASPHDGAYDGVVGVNATSTTIDHSEIWNGNQGIQVNVKRLVTISQNHIHDLGSMASSEDTHGVAICGTGTVASGFTDAITISNNSIHNAGGDAVQEQTNAYCTGPFRYLVIENNDLYNNQEQGFDSKGTSYARIDGNDIYGNGEGAIVHTWDPPSVAMTNWEIYGNKIHDHANYAITSAQEFRCSAEKIYNNLIYNNVSSPPWNQNAVDLCGDAASVFYGNTVYNNTSSGATKSGGVADHGGGNNIKNNIFYNNGMGSNHYGSISSISGQDSGTPDHNYIAGPSQKTGTNVISTCFAVNNCPGFANVTTRDLQLVSGSPARRVGLTLGVPFNVDYFGILRVAPWDLGALASGVPRAPTNLRIVP